MFKSTYTKTVETWYPYQPASTDHPEISPVPEKRSGGFPGWAGAIIGVVLGVALIAGALLFWCLRKRRRHRASQPKSEISERRSRIMGWVLGVPKSGETTVSADDTAYDGDDVKTVTSPGGGTTSEIGSQPLYEMEGECLAYHIMTILFRLTGHTYRSQHFTAGGASYLI